jgi:hypothetical protein
MIPMMVTKGMVMEVMVELNHRAEEFVVGVHDYAHSLA